MSLIQPPNQINLTGRVLALNTGICKSFYCGGFSLSPAQPFSVVTDKAQQDRLHQALLDGRLIDITDQNIKGVSVSGTHQSPAKVLDEKGKRVYLQMNQDGSLTVIAPKDESEEIKMEQELASTGVITIDENNVKIADTKLDTSGKVDRGIAEQLITNMATVLDKARSGK